MRRRFVSPGRESRRCDRQKARRKLARPRLIAFGELEGKTKLSARCEPKAWPKKKARGKLARSRLIAFGEFEGKSKATGLLRAKGMTEEKGTRKAGKVEADCLWRV